MTDIKFDKCEYRCFYCASFLSVNKKSLYCGYCRSHTDRKKYEEKLLSIQRYYSMVENQPPIKKTPLKEVIRLQKLERLSNLRKMLAKGLISQEEYDLKSQ